MIQGKLEAFPDSASDCSIVGKKFVKKARIPYEECDPNDGMDAANKTPFTVLGNVCTMMEYCGRYAEDEILVVKEDTKLLIEWYKLIDLGILHENYPAPLEARKVDKPVEKKKPTPD